MEAGAPSQSPAGRELWTKIMDEFEGSSGETPAEFAARHGVRKTTYRRWLCFLGNEASPRWPIRLLFCPCHPGHLDRLYYS
jgi:hypothetical protein